MGPADCSYLLSLKLKIAPDPLLTVDGNPVGQHLPFSLQMIDDSEHVSLMLIFFALFSLSLSTCSVQLCCPREMYATCNHAVFKHSTMYIKESGGALLERAGAAQAKKLLRLPKTNR